MASLNNGTFDKQALNFFKMLQELNMNLLIKRFVEGATLF